VKIDQPLKRIVIDTILRIERCRQCDQTTLPHESHLNRARGAAHVARDKRAARQKQGGDVTVRHADWQDNKAICQRHIGI
jgi:hypothetical protein